MNRGIFTAITLHHDAACACWRCQEARGVDDGLAPFRARQADPLTCAHPDDDRMPISGDGWLCGHCGAEVEAPSDVVTGEDRIVRIMFGPPDRGGGA